MRDRKGRTRRIGAIALALAMTIGTGVAIAAHLTPSMTDVQPTRYFGGTTEAGGQSVLTRTDGMVVLVAEAANLTPGEAHTVWWVVFNNPSACSDEICNEDDIFTEDGELNVAQVRAAGIGVGNATGNIARGDGTTEFGARLIRNDDSGAHQVLFPAGLEGPGILTASGRDAEVHIIVQTHGNARGGTKLWEQLSLVEAHCTPTCADIQYAVHLP